MSDYILLSKSVQAGFQTDSRFRPSDWFDVNLKAFSEISVLWDSSLQIHIVAEPSTKEKLCGLCGNNNGKIDDDSVMLDGASATSGYELGLGWRSDSDAVCDGPEEYCLAVDQRKNSYAHENCKVIKSQAFAEVSVVPCLVPSVVLGLVLLLELVPSPVCLLSECTINCTILVCRSGKQYSVL